MATTLGGRCPGSARTPEQITTAAAGREAVCQPRLGQVYTAAGPLDLSAMFVMHHGFRRDVRDLARAVPATAAADAEAWAALARRWKGFATALHHHHRVEDLSIWPRLLDRVQAAGDPEARATLEAVQAEHTLLDPLVETCAGGFRAMVAAPDAETRDRLAADVIRTREVLLDHLANEETAALPLAQRYLSVAAWKDAETAARKAFGIADLRFAVPWSALEIQRDQFEIAFAHGGPLVRAILALTRRRFEREHRIAFRHLLSVESV
jgi:hemerythrin-like domain-containing protein